MSRKELPSVVSEKEFRKAVEKFRLKEKKNIRERDRLNAQRRRLPMIEMSSEYVFEGPGGSANFLDLFEGRRQLILYHFMYHPKDDTFCRGCSFFGDQIPHLAHLHARDTSMALVSHAPLKSIKRHHKRMGWKVPWYSAWKNSFNEDLGIDGNREHVLSVFVRNGKKIFRTYYTGSRGVEYLGTPWSFLDITPWGRQETWEDSPAGWPQSKPYLWWRFHDEYKE